MALVSVGHARASAALGELSEAVVGPEVDDQVQERYGKEHPITVAHEHNHGYHTDDYVAPAEHTFIYHRTGGEGSLPKA